MQRVGAMLDRIESNEPYLVEDLSDLAGDREQIPDLWLDTIATRRLKVAVDYLAGVRDLVTSGIHYYAPFPLLRAVLESAATAVWLLESDERPVRLRRLVGLHIDDTNNKKSVQFMVPEQYRDPFDHETGYQDNGSGIRITAREMQVPRLHRCLQDDRRPTGRRGVDASRMAGLLRLLARSHLGDDRSHPANESSSGRADPPPIRGHSQLSTGGNDGQNRCSRNRTRGLLLPSPTHHATARHHVRVHT